MRKDYADQNDFCPDCVNENNETDASAIQCDNEDCCSCCCCCCSGSDYEGGDHEVNPADSENLEPTLDRLSIQKKELLSSLSITRTNRERATIQNVLQFVEALTHSNAFLRRYNLQEDFCLECLEESVRNLFIHSLSRPNLQEQCTCSSCDVNVQDPTSHRITSPANTCPDCPPTSKMTSERPRTRNRRRRRRTRNSFRAHSQVQIQNDRQLESRRQNANPESTRIYDSDCSECRRGHPLSESRSDERLSHCEQCENCEDAAANKNISSPPNLPHYPRGRVDNCADCVQNSSYVRSKTSRSFPQGNVDNCTDCVPNTSNINSKLSDNCCYPRNYCGSDCEDCRSSLTEDAACECCENIEVRNESVRQRGSAFGAESRRGSIPPSSSDKDNTSCDCDDCRDSIDCSDESCDECAARAPRNGKSNKK